VILTVQKIVCLGWGSLIWDPGDLRIDNLERPETAWSTDGPFLPVEFARQSGGNRITLVLVPGRRTVPVLWTQMFVDDLETAKRNLAQRECRRLNNQPATQSAIDRFLTEYCGYWSNQASNGNCSDIVGH